MQKKEKEGGEGGGKGRNEFLLGCGITKGLKWNLAPMQEPGTSGGFVAEMNTHSLHMLS